MRKKNKYFKMNVTNGQERKLSLKLPNSYRTLFERALFNKEHDEYEKSLDALCRFYEEYFELDDADRELFQDIICCGLVRPKTFVNLTILIQTLDNYCVIKGVDTPAKVCEFYVYLAKKFEPDSLTAKLTEDMFDEIGREIVEKECGKFFRGNYYVLMNKKMKVR